MKSNVKKLVCLNVSTMTDCFFHNVLEKVCCILRNSNTSVKCFLWARSFSMLLNEI